MTLVEPLLTWHDPAARALPWRAPDTSPWGILLSEVMTQQTQAERVAQAWVGFVAAFPTPAAMVQAGVGAVIERWQGLGYNRRAVNLHRCAEALVRDHGGQVPRDLDDLLALPGIGPYTARAVQAFAFGSSTLPVDTNVARILARVGDTPLSRKQAQQRADDLLVGADGPPQLAGSVAAALMDLGASICTARSPGCPACPLRRTCAWMATRTGAQADGGPEPADPAARSAHRPRPQGRFEGSQRQARGRVVDRLRRGRAAQREVLQLAHPHGPELLSSLLRDGLVVQQDGWFALPGRGGKS